ncbi:MAG: phosphoribosylformylglycinamidine cyclo-ligase, partial [Candidatus Cloacimonetes bacterium]|nr:phosphoribosylformylglycinamidine cyclo-ligase [Candidatus Cloacimonadota bacterium]
MSDKLDYRTAGVDIRAGEQAVEGIRDLVRSTYNANVIGDLGSFGGLYSFAHNSYSEPILVASTDGVGTKLRVAIKANRYDTIGQDLVNHCVNDILVQGAMPLFFLDYIGLGSLEPQMIKQIVSGMAKACTENGCALIGGEMAEMPGIYHKGDFDLVGTIVGAVDKQNLLPGSRIQKGDILIG